MLLLIPGGQWGPGGGPGAERHYLHICQLLNPRFIENHSKLMSYLHEPSMACKKLTFFVESAWAKEAISPSPSHPLSLPKKPD